MSTLLVLCTQFFLTFAQTSSQEPTYRLEFDKIDNRVEVFIGDSLIFDSGIIKSNPNLLIEYKVDDEFLKYSKNLTVKLINGKEGVRDGDDIHWEIRYYLYKNQKIIDSHWEFADDGKAGVVFEQVITLQ